MHLRTSSKVNSRAKVETLSDEQLALYNRGDVMRFHALEDSKFLVLGGQPLNEPLVSYGPFVMNSQDQINACIRNYRAGLMGQL